LQKEHDLDFDDEKLKKLAAQARNVRPDQRMYDK
jgi:hypothetical protein